MMSIPLHIYVGTLFRYTVQLRTFDVVAFKTLKTTTLETFFKLLPGLSRQ